MNVIFNKKSIFFLVFILSNLQLSKVALSNENKSYELQAGISLLNFGYKEFNTNNVLLDKEDGTIPGLTFALTKYWQYWSADIKLTNHKGLVTYTGQTQSGIPVTSKTDTNILDYSFSIHRWFSSQDDMRYSIYTGYGQHKWHRNIRSTTINGGTKVNDLDETYYWDYIQFGSKIEFYNESNYSWLLDFRFNYSLNADIDVNFVGFDQITLPLGDTWGFHFSSPYQQQIDTNLFVKIEPYYEYWGIERGESGRLRINGIKTNTSVIEPRSNTENFGINFSLITVF